MTLEEMDNREKRIALAFNKISKKAVYFPKNGIKHKVLFSLCVTVFLTLLVLFALLNLFYYDRF